MKLGSEAIENGFSQSYQVIFRFWQNLDYWDPFDLLK